MDDILELQIPSQDEFLMADEFWSNTNTVEQYPTPSPTSASSSGRPNDWPALSPSSLTLTTINHWSHQTQIGWLDSNSSSGPSPTSPGTMRQILAMASSKSTYSNYIQRSAPGNSSGWLKC
jgi:hypothetical protein